MFGRGGFGVPLALLCLGLLGWGFAGVAVEGYWRQSREFAAAVPCPLPVVSGERGCRYSVPGTVESARRYVVDGRAHLAVAVRLSTGERVEAELPGRVWSRVDDPVTALIWDGHVCTLEFADTTVELDWDSRPSYFPALLGAMGSYWVGRGLAGLLGRPPRRMLWPNLVGGGVLLALLLWQVWWLLPPAAIAAVAWALWRAGREPGRGEGAGLAAPEETLKT